MATQSMGLTRYALGRLLQAIPLLLGMIVLSFSLIHLAPGDPVTALIGEYPAPQSYIDEMTRRFGLDQPLWRQMLAYVGNVLQGNLGHSFVNRMPVTTLIAQRIGPTLLLLVGAMLIAMVVGVASGANAARRPGSTSDSVTQVAGLAGYAMPVFWLGQVAVLLFAITLDWLPAGGMRNLREPTVGLERVWEVVRYMALPMLVLAARYVAINMRITRSGVLQAMRSDYVVAARARGVPERVVLRQHALRNAMLPVVTVIGYNLGFALSGSVLVETVFNWPGVGRLLYDSIAARDNPTMTGIFLLVTSSVVVVNLVTDILYAKLDPRIKY